MTCDICGKKVNWIIEVRLYPQFTDSELSDLDRTLCRDCVPKFLESEEMRARLMENEVNK